MDGTGDAELVVPGALRWPDADSPDGRLLAFSVVHEETDVDIFVKDLVDDSEPHPLIQEPGSQRGASFSPDGRFISYDSNESGQREVYVRPFPNVDDGKWQLSRQGGRDPMWRSDGSEIFFSSQGSMVVASIAYEPVFAAGLPEVLFHDPYYRPPRPYGVSADGQRFLMVQEVPSAENDADAPPQIRVILNWLDELESLVP